MNQTALSQEFIYVGQNDIKLCQMLVLDSMEEISDFNLAFDFSWYHQLKGDPSLQKKQQLAISEGRPAAVLTRTNIVLTVMVIPVKSTKPKKIPGQVRRPAWRKGETRIVHSASV